MGKTAKPSRRKLNQLRECKTLKAQRESRNWSQADLAFFVRQRSGTRIDTVRISAYENGREIAYAPKQTAIADVFGMTVEELFPEYFEDEDEEAEA